MDLSEQMRSLVAYDEWADQRILASVEGLDAQELASAPLSGVRSIGDTLAHVLGTRVWWLSRWKGSDFVMPDVSTAQRLRDAYAAVHGELVDYIEGLSDEGWSTRFEAFGPTQPLSAILAQVMLHGVQHRGELAAMLSSLDRSPGDLDYIFLLREHA